MSEKDLVVPSESNVGTASSEAAYQEYKRLKEEERASIDWSKAKVGSAGLYWEPDEDEEETTAKLINKDGSETIINTSIDIGIMGKGNNLSLSVEQGIADYVKELADDEDNHLPSTKVGVMIHYLSEGIARDFETIWNRAPASLGGGTGRGGSTKEGRAAGKRVMSKKQKNELLAKMDMNYYMDDIQAGNMSYEDAFDQVKVAMQQKLDLEALGYYLSPNKTEGVLMYDWKSIVDESYKSEDESVTNGKSASAFYIKYKLEVVLPNIFATYFDNDFKGSNKKLTSELSKSSLLNCVGTQMVKYNVKGLGGSVDPSNDIVGGASFEDQKISSDEDILKIIKHKVKGEVKGIHLVKMKVSGMMKPRWICVDECVDGKQTLHLYQGDSVQNMINS